MRPILQLPDPVQDSVLKALCEDLKLPSAVATVLVHRGYATPDEAKSFLRPRLKDLADPWAMADI